MAFDLIQKITVATPSATVSFSTLPTTYKDLQVFIVARCSNAALRNRFYITINNNTTATDYAQYEWYLEDNALGAEMQTSGINTRTIGIMPSANADANTFGATEICIFDYNNSSSYSGITGWTSTPRRDNTGYSFWQTGNTWFTNAAITNLSFTTELGNFVANSTFYLYGQK